MRTDQKKQPADTSEAADRSMLEIAKRDNDGSMISLAALKESLDGYNGRILARVPRSLHKRLVEEAQAEGVSLNQYVLYKLSK